jgi:hypothetical protein
VAARDLDHQRFTPPAFLWQGILGPGKTTLLTRQWKSGKTTLVALLQARMEHGGQLAGLPVAPGRAFVISEECKADWRARFQHLGIRDGLDLLCRPFTAPPPDGRLAYPFSIMNPAEVPQEVWQRARAAKGST